jgi:hypothetical protein
MLATIGELAVEGLFVLKDVAADFGVPAASRILRELLDRSLRPVAAPPSCCSAPTSPADGNRRPGRALRVAPAQRDDYRGAIVAVVESLRANRRAAVTLARRDR